MIEGQSEHEKESIHDLSIIAKEVAERYIESNKDCESTNSFTIFVEGPSDVQFYQDWLENSGLESGYRKLEISVEEIPVDKKVKPSASGNCQRVRDAAEVYKKNLHNIYISDKDLMTDLDIGKYSHLESLFFTDFPAVESYGFSHEILMSLNTSWYSNRVKSLEYCYDFLKCYLKGIYFYRNDHSMQESRERVKGWTQRMHKKMRSYRKMHGGNITIEGFVEYAKDIIPDMVAEKMQELDDGSVDPRVYAYGHDIGFAIKNFVMDDIPSSKKYPICNEHTIEQYVRDKYIIEGLYKEDSLFELLRVRIIDLYNLTRK